jgi:hypothetical protein
MPHIVQFVPNKAECLGQRLFNNPPRTIDSAGDFIVSSSHESTKEPNKAAEDAQVSPSSNVVD